MSATNFDEFVMSMAAEAPHAVALDWYRRLELTIKRYITARGHVYRDGRAAEEVISADPLLGPSVGATICTLRTFRNALTHEWRQLSPAEAEQFARQAFDLMGRIMRAENAPAI